MKWITCIFLLSIFVSVRGGAQNDGGILTAERFLWFVDNYHPIASQSQLLELEGESAIRKSRGAFDPYLHANVDQKYYENKTYYSLLNGGLKVPTWYGVELKTGYDQNRGVYLNPENNVPENGLVYAGVSVPLGQGLFIDNRRATLRQAQLFAESTIAQRQKWMNDLYLDALEEYWKWMEAWNQYEVNSEAVELAKVRFNGVRQSYLLGDKPAIDTLEAFIQVQTRQINMSQALLSYQNTTLELSNYLWFENNAPLVITDSLRPPSYASAMAGLKIISREDLEKAVQQLARIHPDMQLYQNKLGQLEVERKLKAESLKPEINLQYNFLNEYTANDFASGYSLENYKWGLEFSFPLFLRKQRGDLQLSKIKILNTELGQKQKLLELQNEVRKYYNEQLGFQNQVALYTAAVSSYDQLLSGEKQKYNAGESSLFLINSREQNLIQARLKLIEILTKYNIALAGFGWASGDLY